MVVYGLLVAVLGLMALIVLIISVIRVLDYWLP